MSLAESAAPEHMGHGLCCLLKLCEENLCRHQTSPSKDAKAALHNMQGATLVPFVYSWISASAQTASATQVSIAQDGSDGCKEFKNDFYSLDSKQNLLNSRVV